MCGAKCAHTVPVVHSEAPNAADVATLHSHHPAENVYR
jgi:hypothetical protein